jgi:hypothetical protein
MSSWVIIRFFDFKIAGIGYLFSGVISPSTGEPVTEKNSIWELLRVLPS